MSVVGSASVLAVHERRKLQLALHEQQRDSRVREAHGVLERRQRVRRIDAAREARQTRNLARRLGISAEEIVDIRRRFRDLDEDGSGELDLREVEQLCRTSGRFKGLSRDELQQLITKTIVIGVVAPVLAAVALSQKLSASSTDTTKFQLWQAKYTGGQEGKDCKLLAKKRE